jgi:hypothetical protein
MLKNTKTWRDAVCVVVDEKTNNGRCFSSGEIAKQIREERPDLVFSVFDIGQYLRDLFFNSNIVYNLDGNPIMAYQVSRITTGKSRSPEGIEVFVYCQNIADGLAHDFEVPIPKMTGDFNKADYQEYGSLDGEEDESLEFDDVGPIATVHKDGRLCIPRKAFDKFCMLTRMAIQPGDQVHVRYDKPTNKIFLTHDSNDGSKPYDLTRDKGRVKYTPDDNVSWSPGDTFTIFFTKEALIVDLDTRG